MNALADLISRLSGSSNSQSHLGDLGRDNPRPKSSAKRWVALAVVFGLLLMYFWPLRTVPTGHRGVVTIGGSIRSIQNEGFVLLAPWEKLNIFNIRSEAADIKDAEGPTFDQQPLKASLTVRYSISPDKVGEVFERFSHDGNLDSYVQTATQEVFKAVSVKYTAPELVAKRATVSSDITTALKVKLAVYGAQVLTSSPTSALRLPLAREGAGFLTSPASNKAVLLGWFLLPGSCGACTFALAPSNRSSTDKTRSSRG